MKIRWASKVLKYATSHGIKGPWKRYSVKGGNGNCRWMTTGLMKNQIGTDGRVVLEALANRACADIVVRVFSEEPLEIHYARKASSPDTVQRCITGAIAVFEQIPGDPPMSLGLIESVFNVFSGGALNPPPPPFDVHEIEGVEAAHTQTSKQ